MLCAPPPRCCPNTHCTRHPATTTQRPFHFESHCVIVSFDHMQMRVASRFIRSLHTVATNCRAARCTIGAPYNRFLSSPYSSASSRSSSNAASSHGNAEVSPVTSEDGGRPSSAASTSVITTPPAVDIAVSGPPTRLLGSNIARSYSQHVKGNLDILRQLMVPPKVYAKDNSLDSIIKVNGVFIYQLLQLKQYADLLQRQFNCTMLTTFLKPLLFGRCVWWRNDLSFIISPLYAPPNPCSPVPFCDGLVDQA